MHCILEVVQLKVFASQLIVTMGKKYNLQSTVLFRLWLRWIIKLKSKIGLQKRHERLLVLNGKDDFLAVTNLLPMM